MSAALDGRRLKHLRESKGYSQERLAQESELDTRTVQRAEAGARVRPGTLERIAAALGTTPRELASPRHTADDSFLEVERRIGRRLAQLDSVAGLNTVQYRVDVIDIGPPEGRDDEPVSRLQHEIESWLRKLGFSVDVGFWDDARLLAKRDRKQEEVCVIHRNNHALADVLVGVLSSLNIGTAIHVLSADDVARESVRLSARHIMHERDVVVALRSSNVPIVKSASMRPMADPGFFERRS